MPFKWEKHSEFGTKLNIELLDYWHLLIFPKMNQTYTKLKNPSMHFKWAKYAEFGTELNLETMYY